MPWKLLLFGDADEPGKEPEDSGWRTDDPVEPSAYWKETNSDTDNSDRPSIWETLFGQDDDDN